MSERSERSDERARAASAGPLVLLIPLLSLVVGVLWARRARTPWQGARPAPPAADQVEERDAWVGETTLRGARLVAHLLPLHDAPGRLVFERDVLAERLRLGEGRPWRLQLAWYAPDASGDAGDEVAGLALGDVRVVHAGGALLPAVPRAPEPEPRAVVDPLRALLAPPAAPLGPGHELTLVLWGAAPSGATRLVVGDLELTLEPRRVASTLVPETLARLDRREGR